MELNYQEYLRILEKEYLCYYIRSKFYKKSKDLLYFDKVMVEKEKKIKDITLKNRLNSIFQDKERKDSFLASIILPNDYPNFFYNDKEKEFRKKDILNYYCIGVEYLFVFEKRPLIHLRKGKLNSVDFKNRTGIILIQFDNYISSEEVYLKNLIRIDLLNMLKFC